MSTKEELRNLMRKIEVAPFSFSGKPECAFVRKISDYQTVQRQQLEQLWSEEVEARQDLIQHFNCRSNDANVPIEEPASDVNPRPVTLRHPELTDDCHKFFLKTYQQHLWRNVDRLAHNTNLVLNVPKNLPQVQIPIRARDFLEEFVLKFGRPKPAEVLLLSQALGIAEDTIRAFCKYSVSTV